MLARRVRLTKSKRRDTLRRLLLEDLERRDLMASNLGAMLDQGTLRIEGTTGDDSVEVRRQGDVVLVKSHALDHLFNAEFTFPAVDIARIEFRGYEGHDHFRNATSIPSTAWGGPGDDILVGGSGPDLLFGAEGRDLIFGSQGDDQLDGGAGHDHLVGGLQMWRNPVDALDVNDDGRLSPLDSLIIISELNSRGARKLALFGAEATRMFVDANGDGALSPLDSLLVITQLNRSTQDRFISNFALDSNLAGDGDDRLEGGTGNDLLFGGSGDDTYVFAGERLGQDRIAGEGADAGSDTFDFSEFWHAVTVDIGSEQKSQVVHADHLTLTILSPNSLTQARSSSAESLSHIAAIENVVGSPHNDTVLGNAHDNQIYGGAGDDLIHGGEGDDQLYGEAGSDQIVGDQGNDLIAGGDEDDHLSGGSGNDRYLFTADDQMGSDVVGDTTGVDVLDFVDYGVQANIDPAGFGIQHVSEHHFLKLPEWATTSLVVDRTGEDGQYIRETFADDGHKVREFWGAQGNTYHRSIWDADGNVHTQVFQDTNLATEETHTLAGDVFRTTWAPDGSSVRETFEGNRLALREEWHASQHYVRTTWDKLGGVLRQVFDGERLTLDEAWNATGGYQRTRFEQSGHVLRETFQDGGKVAEESWNNTGGLIRTSWDDEGNTLRQTFQNDKQTLDEAWNLTGGYQRTAWQENGDTLRKTYQDGLQVLEEQWTSSGAYIRTGWDSELGTIRQSFQDQRATHEEQWDGSGGYRRTDWHTDGTVLRRAYQDDQLRLQEEWTEDGFVRTGWDGNGNAIRHTYQNGRQVADEAWTQDDAYRRTRWNADGSTLRETFENGKLVLQEEWKPSGEFIRSAWDGKGNSQRQTFENGKLAKEEAWDKDGNSFRKTFSSDTGQQTREDKWNSSGGHQVTYWQANSTLRKTFQDNEEILREEWSGKILTRNRWDGTGNWTREIYNDGRLTSKEARDANGASMETTYSTVTGNATREKLWNGTGGFRETVWNSQGAQRSTYQNNREILRETWSGSEYVRIAWDGNGNSARETYQNGNLSKREAWDANGSSLRNTYSVSSGKHLMEELWNNSGGYRKTQWYADGSVWRQYFQDGQEVYRQTWSASGQYNEFRWGSGSQSVASSTGNVLNQVINVISGGSLGFGLVGIEQGFKDAWKDITGGNVSIDVGNLGNLDTVFGNFADAFTGANTISVNWSGVGDWADDTWDGFTDWTGERWDAFTDWSGDRWDSFSDWASDRWDSFADWSSDRWDSFADWSSDRWESFADWSSDRWESFADWSSDRWDSFADWSSDRWESFATWSSERWQSFAQWSSERWDAFTDWTYKVNPFRRGGPLGPSEQRGIPIISWLRSNHGYSLDQATIVYQLVFAQSYFDQEPGLQGKYREEFMAFLVQATNDVYREWLNTAAEARGPLDHPVMNEEAARLAQIRFLDRFELYPDGSPKVRYVGDLTEEQYHRENDPPKRGEGGGFLPWVQKVLFGLTDDGAANDDTITIAYDEHGFVYETDTDPNGEFVGIKHDGQAVGSINPDVAAEYLNEGKKLEFVIDSDGSIRDISTGDTIGIVWGRQQSDPGLPDWAVEQGAEGYTIETDDEGNRHVVFDGSEGSMFGGFPVDENGIMRNEQGQIIGKVGGWRAAHSSDEFQQQKQISQSFPSELQQVRSDLHEVYQGATGSTRQALYDNLSQALDVTESFVGGLGNGAVSAVTDLAGAVASLFNSDTWIQLGETLHQSGTILQHDFEQLMGADDKTRFVQEYGQSILDFLEHSLETVAVEFLIKWDQADAEGRAQMVGKMVGTVVTDAVIEAVGAGIAKKLAKTGRLTPDVDLGHSSSKVVDDIIATEDLKELDELYQHRTLTPNDWKLVLAGMDPVHAKQLHDFAKQKDVLLVVRGLNPKGLKWHGQAGYQPKPLDLKFKTDLDTGLVKGTKLDNGTLIDARGNRTGYSVNIQGHIIDKDGKTTPYKLDAQGFIVDNSGNKFFSDYDLAGAYENIPGTDNWAQVHTGHGTNLPPIMKELNEAVGDEQLRMFQHGGNDDYWKVKGDKVRLGNPIDPGERFVVADPYGELRVVDLTELRQIYQERGIPWPLAN